MFTVDTAITDLKIKERSLYRVLFSMNTHQVATPDLNPEEAKSYVFFFREGDRLLSYIGIHFLLSDRKMYYRYSGNPFAESELAAVEDEARSFAEDLGAMLDDLNLKNMSDLEKDSWIDAQDIFAERRDAQKSGEQAQAEQAAPVQEAPQSPAPAAQPAPVQAVAPAQPVPVEAAPQPQPAPVQEAPQPQEPAVQPAPVQTAAPSEPAPVQTPVQAAPQPQQIPEGQTEAASSAEQQQPAPVSTPPSAAPRPAKKAASRKTAEKTAAARPEMESSEDETADRTAAAAVKGKASPQLKKEARSAVGTVKRDREALARLLASF